MRSIRANHNQIAVSAYTAETAINTAQTLDLSLLAQMSDIAQRDTRREHNGDEMTGKEEPDTIYDLGKTVSLPLNFEKAQPQHFSFLYGFGLGTVASAAAGALGFEKTITPMSGDLDRWRSLPSFTAAQRFGKTIFKERFASLFVDQVTATFARDSWVKLSGQCKGTGLSTVSVEEEAISAAENVVSLTLAAKAVAGATAAERLDAIHRIVVDLGTGADTEVVFSAVSAATPAVITIVAPGAGVTVRDYKVIYAPAELGWMTFPARVSQTPLRVSQLTVMLGGAWNGTALVGGRELSSEINSLEHSLANNGAVEFTPGASGAYANSYFRDGRTQTLKLDRELRDYIVQNYMSTNETFAAQILAEGAEYEAGHKYQVWMIFPKLGVLSAPISANGKRLAERGDLIVMEDDTYGSVIVKVKDLSEFYAA